MFGKFFASTFTGSMVGAGPVPFAVWGYVVANTVDSQVELNPRLLAAIIGTNEADIDAAIAYLCAPDPKSRTKDHDGCRLIREGEFAYRVPNHMTYRNILNESDRREYNRIKKAEERARKREVKLTVNDKSAQSAEAEAEAETEAKTTTTAIRPKSDDSPDVGKFPASWVGRLGDFWLTNVGTIQYGRVGKDMQPMIRIWGEDLVQTAMANFARYRRNSIDRGLNGKRPEGWADFVRDFRDHLPGNAVPLAARAAK